VTDPPKKKLALVLSGGGARGAYEAGVVAYIRSQHFPRDLAFKRPFDILCGSSVGAINTCFLAAFNHNLEHQGKKILEIWQEIRQDDIYRRGVIGLANLMGRGVGGILGNIFRGSPDAPVTSPKRFHFNGFLDTSPLPRYLRRVIPWKQISLNIQKGSPEAVSVIATNVHTGKMELFIEKNPSVFYTGRHRANFVTLETEHAMASAAIPLVFPTVRVDGHYYCDGGLRLNTPLSPAVQLGAEKVLVIGLHHESERAEQKDNTPVHDTFAVPTMGEVIGKVLNSIFLDRLEYDLEQMSRINSIIEGGEAVCGPDFLTHFNERVIEKAGRRDVPGHQFKKLEVTTIFPSRDIREIFAECAIDSQLIRKNLTTFEKVLFRLLDVDLRRGQEFLSFILFIPSYIKKLLELGFEDARSNHEALVKFFED